MSGFTGFTEVVSKMKSKLKKVIYVGDKESVAVDVNYNQSLSIQIEPGLIGVINRTQEQIVSLFTRCLKMLPTFQQGSPFTNFINK